MTVSRIVTADDQGAAAGWLDQRIDPADVIEESEAQVRAVARLLEFRSPPKSCTTTLLCR
jgi:hypothetical protein